MRALEPERDNLYRNKGYAVKIREQREVVERCWEKSATELRHPKNWLNFRVVLELELTFAIEELQTN